MQRIIRELLNEKAMGSDYKMVQDTDFPTGRLRSLSANLLRMN